jgi:hypothetical protein
MGKPLTINEVVPKVIRTMKDLQEAIRNKELNDYQIYLILNSLVCDLEHSENVIR